MHKSELVENLVTQSKALGSLEYQKDLAAENARRLADEISGLKEAIADLIQEKKKLPTGQKREAGQDWQLQRTLLTGHQRGLQRHLRSTRQNRRRTLDQKRLVEQQIALFKGRVAADRERLIRNPPH